MAIIPKDNPLFQLALQIAMAKAKSMLPEEFDAFLRATKIDADSFAVRLLLPPEIRLSGRVPVKQLLDKAGINAKELYASLLDHDTVTSFIRSLPSE